MTTRCHLWAVLVSLCGLVAISGTTDRCAAQQPEPKVSIATLIIELGDEKFQVRETAAQMLWKQGDAAMPALKEALKSPDAEVVSRARFLIERIESGITPDTPAELLQLVDSYRGLQSKYDQKLTLLKQLIRMPQGARLARKLLKDEPDENFRKTATRTLFAQLLEEMIRTNELDGVELWLDQLGEDPSTARSSVVLLHVLGKMTEREAKWRDSEIIGDQYRYAIARMIQKDYSTALAVVEKIESKPLHSSFKEAWEALRNKIHLQRHEWSILAKRIEEKQSSGFDVEEEIERAGLLATLHGWAGQAVEQNKYLEEIRQYKNQKPENPEAKTYVASPYMQAEAFWVNEQWDDYDFAPPEFQNTVFETLISQGKHLAAQRLIGYDQRRQSANQWFMQKLQGLTEKTLGQHLNLSIELAESLVELGEKKSAEELLLLTEAHLKTEQQHLAGPLVSLRQKLQLPWHDQAFAALQRIEPNSLQPWNSDLKILTKDPSGMWWIIYRKKFPNETHLQTRERVQEMNRLLLSETVWSDDHAAALRLAFDHVLTVSDNLRRPWYDELVRFCRANQQLEALQQFFLRATNINEKTKPWSYLADVAVLRADWATAVKAYESAYAQDNRLSSLYLQGIALERSGQMAEAKKIFLRAKINYLGHRNDHDQSELLNGLEQRGFHAEAVQIATDLEPLVSLHSASFSSVFQTLGNANTKSNPLQAANYWQILMLTPLRTESSFTRVRDFGMIIEVIHRRRLVGLLTAKPRATDEQLRKEIQAALGANPTNSNISIILYPLLKAAGKTALAEELLEQQAATLSQVLESYPNSAHYHNNLAWMFAKTEQRLDDALQHATKAVELEPKRAGYQDTLAWVYRSRGEFKQALKIMQQCRELEPGNSTFIKQLPDFEKLAKGEKLPANTNLNPDDIDP